MIKEHENVVLTVDLPSGGLMAGDVGVVVHIEEADHDPEKLFAKYERQQADIQELRDQLKDILGEALNSHED